MVQIDTVMKLKIIYNNALDNVRFFVRGPFRAKCNGCDIALVRGSLMLFAMGLFDEVFHVVGRIATIDPSHTQFHLRNGGGC